MAEKSKKTTTSKRKKSITPKKSKKDTGIKDSILKSTIFLSLQRSMIVSCASITAVVIMMAR